MLFCTRAVMLPTHMVRTATNQSTLDHWLRKGENAV